MSSTITQRRPPFRDQSMFRVLAHHERAIDWVASVQEGGLRHSKGSTALVLMSATDTQRTQHRGKSCVWPARHGCVPGTE